MQLNNLKRMNNGVGLFSENFRSCVATRSMSRAIQGNDGREGPRSNSWVEASGSCPDLELSVQEGWNFGHRDLSLSECLLMLGLSQESQAKASLLPASQKNKESKKTWLLIHLSQAWSLLNEISREIRAKGAMSEFAAVPPQANGEGAQGLSATPRPLSHFHLSCSVRITSHRNPRIASTHSSNIYRAFQSVRVYPLGHCGGHRENSFLRQ